VSNQTSSLTIRVGVAGVAGAIGDIQKLAGGILGAFAGITANFNPSAIFDSVKGTLQFGATLKQIHDRTGDSISSLVALDKALTRIGESAGSASNLISKMQRSISEAAQGLTPTTVKDFNLLGIDPQQLAQLSSDKQLLVIAKALDQVANADQRAQIAMDLFGRSGAQMLSLFKDGKAMQILADGAGEFGQVMARNAASFQDAIFDFNQIGYISKKFWAGLLDQIPVQAITDAVTGALEAIDFVGFGQKTGALVTVIINSWRDGKFPEMLGLLVEAGFELGVDAVKKIWVTFWSALTSATAGQIYLALINAIMSFGVGAAKFLIKVLTEPIIYMAAGFDWLGSHIKEVFTDAINFFIQEWDKVAAKVPGLGKLTLPLIDKRGSDTFSESLADMRKFIEPLFSGATDFLSTSLQQSKEALGINEQFSASDNTRGTAISRLNNLIQEQLNLRKSVKAEETQEAGAFVKAFDTKTFLAQQEVALNEDLLKIKKQLAQVEGDFTQTAAQKYSQRKALLQSEVKEYQDAIAQNDALIKSGKIPSEYMPELSKRQEHLATGLTGAQDSLSKIGADPNSFADQFASKITALQDQWGTAAQQMAQTFSDVFSSAVSSVSSGITGLIMGTKTWGQTLMQIGSTVLQTIIQQIVEMGIKFVMSHVIMRAAMVVTHAIGMALGWQQVATTNSQEASKAPALAANAATASVGSYGSAAIIGAIAAVAAIGLITAAALGAFDTGGYTGAGGKYDVAGVVHRGEYVMSADSVNRIGLPTLEALHSGGDIASAGVGGGTTLHVHTWADENSMLKFLRENDDAKHVIIDHVSKNVRFA
jgi:predicted  nucleic acid-binding Zn-ribbon protein